MRIVVVLPAPLLPTKPNTSPGRTAKATPSSAWTVPNRFDMPPMSSMPTDLDGDVRHGSVTGP
jgi:hypothetical protein